MSKGDEIGEKIAIGVAAGVGTALTLGALGSIMTMNPAPLLAALKISAIASGAAAGTSGGTGGNS